MGPDWKSGKEWSPWVIQTRSRRVQLCGSEPAIGSSSRWIAVAVARRFPLPVQMTTVSSKDGNDRSEATRFKVRASGKPITGAAPF